MRVTILAIVATLAFVSVADAGSMGNGASQRIAAAAAANTNPVGPFKLDTAGNCLDGSGKYALRSYCDATGAPHCATGKACGNICIKVTDACRKP